MRLYNHDRPHSSLGGSTPAERIADLAPKIPARDAVQRTARWLAENRPEPGGPEETVLTDPFDYRAEDKLMDSWLAARAMVEVPEFATQPRYGLAYSGPMGRPRKQEKFVP